MLGLPASTELSKQLPKKAIYLKFGLNNAAKERFDRDISRITIVNEISPITTTLTCGEEVPAIYVLLVDLKSKDYAENTIAMLPRLIEQKMVLVLEADGEARLAVFHDKLILTEWKPIGELTLSLNGLNLDKVWENIIVQIGNIEISDGNTLDEQIIIDEERKKTLKEIARLEKLAKSESQPKKKFEIHQKINYLKKEIQTFGN